MITSNTKIILSKVAPNPKECGYWGDLSEDKYGRVIKVFTANGWQPIAGSGTSVSAIDYSQIENKPTINGVELDGNITLDDLGVLEAEDIEPIIADNYIDNDELQQAIDSVETSTGIWNDVEQ